VPRTPRIVGLGGGGDTEDGTRLLYDYALDLAGKKRPRLLYVPTAVGDADSAIVSFYERLHGRAELSHLRFFPWPPADLRELAFAQDAICVSGGNTANMLAIWRVHGFDAVLREAWQSGVVLFGASAGMICWFQAGVTDSFGPGLAPLRDGLGFLAGSACPHYDDEELRRPMYQRLIREEGFSPGHAADAGVGLVFVDGELTEVVTPREGATGYRVDADGETPLDARLLA